jgi:hypothetical protein
MPEPRRTIGIFGDDTDPNTDADVIMTAAIVGYAQKRLVTDKKVCAFAAAVLKTSSTLPILRISEKIKNYKEWLEKEVEPKVKSYSSQVSTISKDEIDFTKGGILLANAIDRVNLALGIGPQQEGPRVELDATPNYGEGGIIWIVGGTGDLGLDNANRYVNSPDRSQKTTLRVNYVGSNDFVGYKGPGAYTGMSARQNGESYIYSTFRGYPSDAAGQRWLPANPELLGFKISDNEGPDGKLKCVSIWGIIGDNLIAQKTAQDYHMVYRDLSQKAEKEAPYQKFVVGYTHGMIQAIYDVVQSQFDHRDEDKLSWGVPYEIGLKGKTAADPSTTKMASCFYCSLFMEANGKPASSIHLGLGESWAPTYFNEDLINANSVINIGHFDKLQCQKSIDYCNQEWAKLCLDVLQRGLQTINLAMLEEDHVPSFQALQNYLGYNKSPQSAANLILDSATVPEKLVVRVVRTLKAPGQ